MTTIKTIRKGLLASLLTLTLTTAAGAYGTFAYFSDAETSTDNIFQAGTLDLTLSSATTVNGFIGHDNFAPGDTVSGALTLTNDGTISSNDGDGHTVSLDIASSLLSTDADGVTTDMAQYLQLTTLDYDGATLLASVTDSNANGYLDLEDLAATSLTGLADPGAAGKVLDVTVDFHTTGGNSLQGDSVELTLDFTLSQS